jgi:hypothetical protein
MARMARRRTAVIPTTRRACRRRPTSAATACKTSTTMARPRPRWRRPRPGRDTAARQPDDDRSTGQGLRRGDAGLFGVGCTGIMGDAGCSEIRRAAVLCDAGWPARARQCAAALPFLRLSGLPFGRRRPARQLRTEHGLPRRGFDHSGPSPDAAPALLIRTRTH